MIKELTTLERKVAEVSALCRALRNENDELRQQVENSEKERRNMAERLEQARTRIEQLIQQLPETTSPEHS